MTDYLDRCFLKKSERSEHFRNFPFSIFHLKSAAFPGGDRLTLKKPAAVGGVFSAVHFLVELTTFYILYSYFDSKVFLLLPLVYDFFAFVPQGVFGALNDVGVKINFSLAGAALMAASLVCVNFGVSPYVVIALLSLGNAMVHVHAAEATLRVSQGKMAPSALFVAGGSFGLIAGRIMGMNHVSFIYVLILHSLIFVLTFFTPKISELLDKKAVKFDYANTSVKVPVLISLATAVVAVRAFMGYGIPTSWNKTLLQTVLLFCFMGVGKALGGVLIDKVGIRKTAFISTVVALPFLLCGDQLMMVSLIGVMFFSMTMAVTLALIVSAIPEYPGIAFGFTTIGLFIGSAVSFYLRFDSFFANAAAVFILTAVSVVILHYICKDKKGE